MTFDAEKEINRLWKGIHSAQDDIAKAHYRWRQAAIELAGADVKPLDVSLKAAEITGAEIGKSFLARLNWLKGEPGWLMGLAGSLAGNWTNQGAVVAIDRGKDPYELFIKWDRCPWPTFAKEYEVNMEEDVLVCDRILETILHDVNIFFDVEYKIETLKAILRGQGVCLRRLYKVQGA